MCVRQFMSNARWRNKTDDYWVLGGGKRSATAQNLKVLKKMPLSTSLSRMWAGRLNVNKTLLPMHRLQRKKDVLEQITNSASVWVTRCRAGRRNWIDSSLGTRALSKLDSFLTSNESTLLWTIKLSTDFIIYLIKIFCSDPCAYYDNR